MLLARPLVSTQLKIGKLKNAAIEYNQHLLNLSKVQEWIELYFSFKVLDYTRYPPLIFD